MNAVADRVMMMPKYSVMEDNPLQVKAASSEIVRMKCKQCEHEKKLQMKPRIPELQRMCPRCQEDISRPQPQDHPKKKLGLSRFIQKHDDGKMPSLQLANGDSNFGLLDEELEGGALESTSFNLSSPQLGSSNVGSGFGMTSAFCSPRELRIISSTRSRARQLLGNSIRRLGRLQSNLMAGVIPRLDHDPVACALGSSFNLNIRVPAQRAKVYHIKTILSVIMDELRGAPPTYYCETPGSSTYRHCSGTEAEVTEAFVVRGERAIHFCPAFFDTYDPRQQTLSMLHEHAHFVLPPGNETYARFRGGRVSSNCLGRVNFTREVEDLIQNADSYANFVGSVNPL